MYLSDVFKIRPALSFIDRTILIILKLAVHDGEEKAIGKDISFFWQVLKIV
jgi:hypothetical protein